MRRIINAIAATGFVLLLAGPAGAKIAGDVEIQGAGLTEAIVLDGSDSGDWWNLARVMQSAPTAESPIEELGPRYIARYRIAYPEHGTLTQHLYPYGEGGIAIFTPANQTWPWSEPVPSGWTMADDDLKGLLVDNGLPATAPAAGLRAPFRLPPPAIAAICLALLAGLISAEVLGRRRRAAAA